MKLHIGLEIVLGVVYYLFFAQWINPTILKIFKRIIIKSPAQLKLVIDDPQILCSFCFSWWSYPSHMSITELENADGICWYSKCSFFSCHWHKPSNTWWNITAALTSICQWDLNVFQTSLNIFIKLKFNIQIETCICFCLNYLSI